MHRRHSRALKRFIYLLIAMTIFSAVGVMVIYLNISPTAPVIDTTIPVTTEQQLIDIPGFETDQPTPALTTGEIATGAGTDTGATNL